MSPDQIKTALAKRFPELKARARKNPNGWALFLGVPRGGVHTNRILRATRSRPTSETRLKLSVSSKISGKDVELVFAGSESELHALVAKELKLYQEHFAK
jgi:hypothetical protein